MDIPRIGYGSLYRPPQVGFGRTGDGGQEVPDGQSDTRALNAKTSGSQAPGSAKAPGAPLSEEEQRQVAKLKAVDAKVRQHEAAHQAAGGGLVGGASYTYTKGPDGGSYATGGEVPISAPAARSPDAAIQQAQQVKAAALAPADPSGQDLAVAASADASMAQARRELAAKDPAAPQAGSTQAGSGGGGARSGATQGGDAPPQAGATDGAPRNEPAPGLPAAPAPASEAVATIPAQVARGVAAYGAAARINAAPGYASALFA